MTNSIHPSNRSTFTLDPFKALPEGFSEKVNLIAFEIFAQYSKKGPEENFVYFIPCLLSNLSLLYANSPPNLKDIFEKEFHLEKIKEKEWHQGVATWTSIIIKHVKKLQEQESNKPFDFTLTADQAIAIKNSNKLNPQLIELMNNPYSAELIVYNNVKEAEVIANEWIEQKTEGEIKNLIDEIHPKSQIIFLSAAVFKGSWEFPFDKNRTQKEIFADYKGDLVMVDKMYADSDNYRFGLLGKNNDIKVMELSFRGDIAMIIFLPTGRASEAVQKLNDVMTQENLSNFFSEYDENLLSRKSMSISLPRLKISEKDNLFATLSNWPLIQEIIQSNLNSIFLNPSKKVLIDKLIIQTNLSVDEEGAAIKAAMYTACYEDSCPPKPFYVDHPFAYAFFDKHTSTILAMGRITSLEGEALSERQQNCYTRYYS